MIKHIIFDLGKVIVNVDLQPFLHKFSDEFKIDPLELTNDDQDGVHREFMVGRLTGEEFHKVTCEKFNHFIPIEHCKEIWISMLSGEIRGISSIIKKLYKNRYTLSILSNTDPWHYEYCLEMIPCLRLFQNKFLSYDLKMKKPDPEIFEYVAETLKAKPERCLFIDDRLDNISAARAQNFNSIQFQNSEDLQKDLLQMGIKLD